MSSIRQWLSKRSTERNWQLPAFGHAVAWIQSVTYVETLRLGRLRRVWRCTMVQSTHASRCTYFYGTFANCLSAGRTDKIPIRNHDRGERGLNPSQIQYDQLVRTPCSPFTRNFVPMFGSHGFSSAMLGMSPMMPVGMRCSDPSD